MRPFLHLGRSPITIRPLFLFFILGRSPITMRPILHVFLSGQVTHYNEANLPLGQVTDYNSTILHVFLSGQVTHYNETILPPGQVTHYNATTLPFFYFWVGHPSQLDHFPCFFYLGRSPITTRPLFLFFIFWVGHPLQLDHSPYFLSEQVTHYNETTLHFSTWAGRP